MNTTPSAYSLRLKGQYTLKNNYVSFVWIVVV